MTLTVFMFLLQSDDREETMPLSSFYMRKRPARQSLFSSPHYLSKTASPGLVCMTSVEEHCVTVSIFMLEPDNDF